LDAQKLEKRREVNDMGIKEPFKTYIMHVCGLALYYAGLLLIIDIKRKDTLL
jgi:hypothetical protein